MTQDQQNEMRRLAEMVVIARRDRERCEHALTVLRSKEILAKEQLASLAERIEREKRFA